MPEEREDARGRERGIPTISTILPDGALVELIYLPNEHRSAFAVWRDGTWTIRPSIETGPGLRLVPYSPNNNLLRNQVVLLPSSPSDYDSERALLGDIRLFIHRYVDVSPLFEAIASHYVLLTWIYDSFNELPYLRLRGDPGTGKTRFLLTVGSLCYKPMFASGASTVSPLFRIIDSFRGTLIIDEADFRMTDERAEIVKILNNGNARGFPVLRAEVSGKREFDPRAYAVFGPKLVATRRVFEDRALESRCITEDMGQHRLRDDVPINLPPGHQEEALELRNKLLLFRFRNRTVRTPREDLVDRTIEPRLNQIFVPLMSIIDDGAARAELRELARRYHEDLATERSFDTEAQVLEVIRSLVAAGELLSVKAITARLSEVYGNEYDRRISTKWVGGIIRRRLNLVTQKSHGVFIVPPSQHPKLPQLFEKFGLTDSSEASAGEPSPAGGHGDVGDVPHGGKADDPEVEPAEEEPVP